MRMLGEKDADSERLFRSEWSKIPGTLLVGYPKYLGEKLIWKSASNLPLVIGPRGFEIKLSTLRPRRHSCESARLPFVKITAGVFWFVGADTLVSVSIIRLAYN